MKQVIKKSIQILCLTVLILTFVFIGTGYYNYRYAIYKMSVNDKIASIRNMNHYVEKEDINPDLFKATIAIEDRRFYEHNGIELRSIVRAAIGNVLSDGIKGGGSTITQQLAKNMYFGYTPSYIRKVSEVFLAHDLERMLTKDEILELYVNIINYGANQMGIYNATTYYFDKTPDEITLNEATLLAGIPQSPANYQLTTNYDQALQRQQQVLSAMVEEQMISQQQMDDIIYRN